MTKHGMQGTRFYRIWQAMNNRCNNAKDKYFYKYGGRGIKVCERWRKFENFYEDMFQQYQDHCDEFGEGNTSIDRIDNDLGYNLENCRWATNEVQSKNKGINRNNSSGVKGVAWRSDLGKWTACIGVNYKLIYLGSFETKELAIGARDEAEQKYWRNVNGD